jgi:aspartyl/glutamyl-tRNA(Asn/Gln) amidotransferase C subunit
MSITQDEIKKISKNLAKLAPKNEEKLVESINSILNYIDLLNEIDTSDVVPTVSVISKKHNSFKKDEEKRCIEPISLLKCSPQKIIANQIAISDIMK